MEDLQQLYKSTFLGQLAAQYYLSCKTMLYLDSYMAEDGSIDDLILNICHVEEYALFPVRHNEDNINRDMVVDLNLKTRMPFDSPHLKVQLMLMFYLLDKKLPNQEYVLDLKSVFDQIMRIIQAMVSLASQKGWLDCTMKLIYLSQMIMQGLMISRGSVSMLPHINEASCKDLQDKLHRAKLFHNETLLSVAVLRSYKGESYSKMCAIMKDTFGEVKAGEILKTLRVFPVLGSKLTVKNLTTKENVHVKIDRQKNVLSFEEQAGRSCLIEFEIKREGSDNLNIYSRKFNKQKEESWCLIMSDRETVICLQRFTVKRRKFLSIPFNLPTQKGTHYYSFNILCDSYIGLDQKIELGVLIV